MKNNDVEQIIKQKLQEKGGTALIPLKRGGYFTAKLVDKGIVVDNLADQPFLPWIVFQETINHLIQMGGTAKRGDAMKYKLGETGLSLDSVEGHIASLVYGYKNGDSVFRRITPIARILAWAEICQDHGGNITLIK